MQLWTAFLLGLVGSLHCAGMCGPLVLAVAKARPPGTGGWAGRLCYHGGRVACYSLLGSFLGLVGFLAVPAVFQRWLSLALGLALLFSLVAPGRLSATAPVMKLVVRLKGSMQRLLGQGSLFSQAAMGAVNGLLPCGLVYVAAAGATATGHPGEGAAYMALFGLGTAPMMLGIHLAGQRLPLPSRLPLAGVMRAAVCVMAALLILRGLELGIPFVSPNLSAAGTGVAHCH